MRAPGRDGKRSTEMATWLALALAIKKVLLAVHNIWTHVAKDIDIDRIPGPVNVGIGRGFCILAHIIRLKYHINTY
jgi:hypothetical protein